MADIVTGPIGTAGSYDVAFAAGKLVISGTASLDGFSAAVNLSVDSKVVLDALALKIGGPIAPEVAKILELAFAAV